PTAFGLLCRATDRRAAAARSEIGSILAADRRILPRSALVLHTQGIPMSPSLAERGTQCRVDTAMELHPTHLYPQPPADGSMPTIEEAVLLTGLLAVAVAVGTTIERMKRVRAEASQYAASERLQKILLSCISHDLKTPLTGVIGSLSTLLEERALGQEGRQELTAIAYREAKQLDRFVTQILEMTRLEAEAFRVRQERLDVRGVIDSAADQLREIFEERP